MGKQKIDKCIYSNKNIYIGDSVYYTEEGLVLEKYFIDYAMHKLCAARDEDNFYTDIGRLDKEEFIEYACRMLDAVKGIAEEEI